MESGDKKVELELNAGDWRVGAPALKVWVERELGVVDLSPGDLRFIPANLAYIWFCAMEPLTARLRRAVMGRSWPFVAEGDEDAGLHLSRML